jgi:hypothetical protein
MLSNTESFDVLEKSGDQRRPWRQLRGYVKYTFFLDRKTRVYPIYTNSLVI